MNGRDQSMASGGLERNTRLLPLDSFPSPKVRPELPNQERGIRRRKQHEPRPAVSVAPSSRAVSAWSLRGRARAASPRPRCAATPRRPPIVQRAPVAARRASRRAGLTT
jgi:hypothetical protein